MQLPEPSKATMTVNMQPTHKCEECGFTGRQDEFETVHLPEGHFDKCPKCHAPDDCISEIS